MNVIVYNKKGRDEGVRSLGYGGGAMGALFLGCVVGVGGRKRKTNS